MSRKAKREVGAPVSSIQADGVERMKEGRIRDLAKELGVPVSGLYRWKELAEGRLGPGAETADDPHERRVRELEKKVKELEGVIGQKSLELDFFTGALRRIKE